MDGVEERESDEHEGGVEDVLIRFVDGDTGAVAVGVLDQAEDDADLGEFGVSFASFICEDTWEEGG